MPVANPKIALLENEIDSARCKSLWSVSRDLGKKYQRKYFQDGSVLEFLVAGESAIYSALSGKKDSSPYDTDAPEDPSKSLCLPNFQLPRNSLSDAITLLTQAVTKPNTSPVIAIWIQQAHTLLSWIEFICDGLNVSTTVISRLKALPEIEFANLPSEAGQFAKTMWTMKNVLLGWAYLGKKEDQTALEYFLRAASPIIDHLNKLNSTTSATSPNLSPEHDQWLYWAEEALYKSSMQLLRTKDSAKAHDYMIHYIRLVDNTPATHSAHRKASIIGRHLRMLINSSSVKPSPFKMIPKPTITFDMPIILYSEFRQHLLNYEKIVTSLLPFPRAEDETALERNRSEKILEAYEWWTLFEATPFEDEPKGDTVERHYRLLDTFVFGDNTSSQERKEAEACVDTYVFHWSKRLEQYVETVRKKRKDDAKHASGVTKNGSVAYDGVVKVKYIDGETISDAVGVLVSGIRMILWTAEGDETKLRQALNYGEKAIYYLKNHADVSTEVMNDLLRTSLKMLGVVCGELALEVRDSDERVKYRAQAVECLEEAFRFDETRWDIAYQLALQYAEIGEIQTSIDTLNKGLSINQGHTPSWNLLALLLSSRKDLDQALKVCEVGWKACVAGIASGRQETFTKPVGSKPDVFTWDTVGSTEKEDLINFRLTKLALEVSRLGPHAALESLQTIFTLFRKFFGNIGADDIKDPPTMRSSSESASAISDGKDSKSSPNRHTRGMTGTSNLASTSSLPTFYSFRVYDLLICLWLTASSLYRQVNQFEDAKSAVDEAEKLADILSKIDIQAKVGNRIGRSDRYLPTLTQVRGRARQVSKNRERSVTPKYPMGEDAIFLEKWGPVDIIVRRVLADISFEHFLIKQARYRWLNRSIPTDKLTRHLSPVAQVELLRKQESAKVRLPNSYSSASLVSTSSAGVSLGGVEGGLNGSIPSGLTMTPVSPKLATTAGFEPVEEEVPLTLESLINDFFLVTLLDDDHLPARVHLGMLYSELGDYTLAAHWLERATKQNKSRGAGGGRSGITTYYGGSTSFWGWEGWRWLGKSYQKTGRIEQAKNCLYFAIGIERISPVRGFECLSRIVE
ncbi:hypothetical protein HK098_006351 [Nowakowskiella sp. JEL0407]|nr:hypothetical protein HK098_006351 [Nowakowskiella sp. JEL0407]